MAEHQDPGSDDRRRYYADMDTDGDMDDPINLGGNGAAFDPDAVHLLRADLDFGGGITASAETVFGGSAKAEAATDLTAVLVELEKGADLPGADALAGWLEGIAPGAGGSVAAKGCSDHQVASALARSRTTTLSGHGAPSAIQRRRRSTSASDSGGPSLGMAGGWPASAVTTSRAPSAPCSSWLPGRWWLRW